MECTKVNCPMQAGTPTDNCGENCPWRTTAKTGDLISRTVACLCIGNMIHEYQEKGEDDLADGMILARRYGIKCLPAVDATPVVHGRWLYEHDDPVMLPCSVCGYEVYRYNSTPYCPNCGAKMDGRDSE